MHAWKRRHTWVTGPSAAALLLLLTSPAQPAQTPARAGSGSDRPASSPAAAPLVTLSLDPSHPGPAIPPDFCGLSYEATAIVPDEKGRHLFAETNRPLLHLYKTLGVRNLRIGGNSSERATTNPSDADRAALFRFAEAGNLNVIFSLRMSQVMDGSHPADQAAQVAIAHTLIRDFNNNLQALQLANEPDHLMASTDAPDHPRVTYQTYSATVLSYLAAITSQPRNARNTAFCGPSTTGKGAPTWPARFAADYHAKGRIAFIAQHWYPGGDAAAALPPERFQEKLLSPGIHDLYQSFYDSWVPQVLVTGLPFRLDETNSVGLGGAPGASDAFAAALWGLDYLHWWAARGAVGLNFHNGGPPAGALYAPVMPAFFSAGYEARPLAYAMKAFDLGSRGRRVPVKLENPRGVNLTAYGVLGWDGALSVTLVNREHGAAGKPASVVIQTGGSFAAGQMWLLQAPNNDVSAKSGVTFGGAGIAADGTWNGAPSPLPVPSSGPLTVEIPPATAAVIHLTAASGG